MRKLVFLALLLVSCSTEKKVVNLVSAPSCQLQSQWDGSSLLVCGDGSSYALSAAQAASCSVYEDPTDSGSRIIECPDGSRTKVSNGSKGQDGLDGKAGENGKDGIGCNTKSVSGGVEIQCGTDAPVLVKNGIDGKGCTINPGRDGAIIRCGEGIPVTIKNGKDAPLCAIGLGERGVHIRCGDNPEVILIKAGESSNNCSASATEGGTEILCATRRILVQNGFDGPGCAQSFDNTGETWRCSPGSRVELIVDL